MLRSKFACHELGDGVARGVAVEQDAMDHLNDWHVDVALFGVAVALREAASTEAVPFVYFQF